MDDVLYRRGPNGIEVLNPATTAGQVTRTGGESVEAALARLETEQEQGEVEPLTNEELEALLS